MSQGLNRSLVLSITGLSKHQMYYRPSTAKRGRKPSVSTLKRVGSQVVKLSNEVLIDQIKSFKKNPLSNYGYKKMTIQLLLEGYYINHKKVNRIMKEQGLLFPKAKKASRNYVKYRIVIPERPLQVLEMDIKMVWVTSIRRHAYILTIIDTFTRAVLHWRVGLQMTQHQVKLAWDDVIVNHLQAADLLNQKIDVEVRNDNGPQFAAIMVQKYFKENKLNQVFTHPYTPQENGHIESFHSILAKHLDNFTFWDIQELDQQLMTFYDNYNNARLHGSIAYLWPMLFWEMWDKKMISREVNKNKKVKFKLKIPYQLISGNKNLREVSC